MSYFKDLENKLHWLDDDSFSGLLPAGSVAITNEEATAIQEASIIPPTYAELRAAEYPPITDFLDAFVKGDTSAYVAACLAVKAKYPKGA